MKLFQKGEKHNGCGRCNKLLQQQRRDKLRSIDTRGPQSRSGARRLPACRHQHRHHHHCRRRRSVIIIIINILLLLLITFLKKP